MIEPGLRPCHKIPGDENPGARANQMASSHILSGFQNSDDAVDSIEFNRHFGTDTFVSALKVYRPKEPTLQRFCRRRNAWNSGQKKRQSRQVLSNMVIL